LAKELIRQFGTLAVVILYRSSKYGSLFDFEKFKEIASWQFNPASQLFSVKTRINYFVVKLLKAIEDCFAKISSKDENNSNSFLVE